MIFKLPPQFGQCSISMSKEHLSYCTSCKGIAFPRGESLRRTQRARRGTFNAENAADQLSTKPIAEEYLGWTLAPTDHCVRG
jgi:hypothetical protein